MLTAKDIMTKDVITVTPETSIEDLSALLVEHAISGVPVVDRSGALYGIITETSIGLLFIAGIFPGLCLAAFLSIYIMIVTKIRPSLAPTLEAAGWRERIVSLGRVWPILLLSLAVMGSIYGGVATPTEAAGIGAFGAMVIAAIYGKLTRKTWRSPFWPQYV